VGGTMVLREPADKPLEKVSKEQQASFREFDSPPTLF